jgi:hypothetical protein
MTRLFAKSVRTVVIAGAALVAAGITTLAVGTMSEQAAY